MTSSKPRPVRELAAFVGGEVIGDSSRLILEVNGLLEAGPDDLSFFGNPRYRSQLAATRAGAVLVGSDGPSALHTTLIRVANPHLAFAKISALFHPPKRHASGRSPACFVDPSAKVDPTATLMPGATVMAAAKVGPRTVLYPGVYIGEQAEVGADCVLHPNASVADLCVVGDRVTLHAGAVIGADGFGFAFDPEGPSHVKIPQAGRVRVEDDVEIGACSCVDRATRGETVIGRGSKIDNLVQIAHNVRVGPLSIICAQVGVSGSAELGTGVVLAGQVGVVGHIRVGDMVKVGAQSGVAHPVEDGAVLSGSPAIQHREWLKASAAFQSLPGLLKELRALRKRVDALETVSAEEKKR